MARGRFTPWPSYVDLFSALLVATLGLSMVLSGEKERLELAQTKEQQVSSMIFEKLKSHETSGGFSVDQCSAEDICLNVSLEFELNKDVLSVSDTESVRAISRQLLELLSGDVPDHPGLPLRTYVQVVVEGHSDDRQATFAATDRDRFKFNWDLSARRASSVLYEMGLNKLGRENGFNVVSWGRADSDPLISMNMAQCEATPEICRQRNRRTTIRLKFDYKRFREEQGAGLPAQAATTP